MFHQLTLNFHLGLVKSVVEWNLLLLLLLFHNIMLVGNNLLSFEFVLLYSNLLGRVALVVRCLEHQLEARFDFGIVLSVCAKYRQYDRHHHHYHHRHSPDHEQIDAVRAPHDDLLHLVVGEATQRDVADANQLVAFAEAAEEGETARSHLFGKQSHLQSWSQHIHLPFE